MNIQIITSTHPDLGTETTVYIDGKRASEVHIENIDPGIGYSREEYRERLQEAQEQAAKPEASEFDKALAEALRDNEQLFGEYATD